MKIFAFGDYEPGAQDQLPTMNDQGESWKTFTLFYFFEVG